MLPLFYSFIFPLHLSSESHIVRHSAAAIGHRRSKHRDSPLLPRLTFKCAQNKTVREHLEAGGHCFNVGKIVFYCFSVLDVGINITTIIMSEI